MFTVAAADLGDRSPHPPSPPGLPVRPEPPDRPASAGRPEPPGVRPARLGDAAALYALSRTFVRSGALRARTPRHYLSRVEDFLVAGGAERSRVRGCLALRGEGPATAVLYNFCVSPCSQGQGVGSQLLGAAFARARRRSVRVIFTATTGSAALFLRHGFVPVPAAEAPARWAAALDPARGSQVLRLTL
ncbi:GNAT family N-acetyltransferase [Streptomyces goshikiensis]|uniref:GNAT family N-acetyltransferase n=1 Tax=Streptomyces goshikiensis TaxID=1942 RepID=UPI0036A3404F